MSERKLSAADVAEIRAQYAAGASKENLAEGFDVSPRHIARVVSGTSHPVIEGRSVGPAAAAVERFIDGPGVVRAG